MLRNRIVVVALAALAATACGKSRPVPGKPATTVLIPGGGPGTGGSGGTGGDVTVSLAECTKCHGTPDLATLAGDAAGIAIAPPRDASGHTAGRQVGAHRAHLRGASGSGPGLRSAGIDCATCHVVPTSVGSHPNRKVELRGLASAATTSWAGTVAPQYTASTTTAAAGCAATYCHGNFPGGLARAMSWAGTSTDAACGTCHGAPPQFQRDGVTAHPGNTACAGCHGAGYDVTGITGTALATHLDGVFQSPLAGHPSDWKEPDRHGLAAINRVVISGQPQGGVGFANCTTVGCHVSFGAVGSAGNISSCNACHAQPAAVGGTYATGTYPNHANWQTECVFCHGGRGNATGAPPRDTHLISSNATVQPTTGSTIGAHASHVTATHGISTALACTACHPGPYTNATTDAGHVNHATGDIAFGNVGPTPDPGSYSGGGCATTYCHGNFPGGAGATPAWTGTFGGAFTLNCTSCHGNPPALATTRHPPSNACASCHGAGYSRTGATTGTVAAATHVNGTMEKPANGCTACHGTLAGLAGAAAGPADLNAAPGFAVNSVDAAGNSAGNVVGAHQKHLTGTTLRATPIGCAECHAVPAAGDTAHATGAGTGGARATLTWGTIATGAPSGAPVSPTFSGSTSGAGGGAAGSCASTWCHGNIPNGTNPTMSWTGASATAACGSCHGLPPAGTHPGLTAGTACSGCHPGYGGTAGGAIGTFSVSATLHLNGVVDAQGNHPSNWKEPNQHGLAAINQVLVAGQPQGGTGFAGCLACHTGFGPVVGAISDCNGCHASPNTFGPYATSPVTGYPNHPTWQTECTFCHGGRDNTASGAPPRNTHVISSDLATPQPTTDATIGAHTSHVGGTGATQTAHGIAAPLGCADCHPGPYASATDAGHVNGTTADVLGAVSYTRPTCSASACHGNGPASVISAPARGTATTPVWTTVNGSQATCGSCHKAPPGSANHHNAAALTTCNRCHGTTVDASGAILVAGGLHMNDAINTAGLTCSTCHGNAANLPVGSQDGNLPAAPLGNATASAAPDTFGNLATTSAGVGVHASHLLGARSRPVLCNACHTVPGTPIHKTGTATAGAVGFGALATTGGITNAAYAGAGGGCNATYCHGNFGGGAGSGATATWVTAGTLGCTSCHGNPPALATTRHPPSNACASCHGAGYSRTGATTGTVAAATHVNGTMEKPANGCTACHGTLAGLAGAAAGPADLNAAPGYAVNSVDAAGNSAGNVVGAHQKHLTGTTLRATPIGCAECHAVPAAGDTAHATGAGTGGARATLTWGTIATGAPSGAPVSPTFTGSTSGAGGAIAGSCASTWCHGNIPNGTNPTMSWTGASATAACGSCHGLPPAGTHPGLTAGTACSGCHPGYGGTAGGAIGTFSVNPATHLDGTIDSTGHPNGWKEPNQHGLAAVNRTVVVGQPVGGTSFAGCTTCHTGFGPVGAAGAVSSCDACHAQPAAVGGTYATGTYPNHASWQTECTFCHGGRDNTASGAPPRTTSVISTDLATTQPTSNVAIGAHTSHVGGTGATQTAHGIDAPLGCADCHSGTHANATTDLGHVGAANSSAAVLAALGWSRAAVAPNPANSCATSTCHGAGLNATTTRGTASVPVWTTVNGSQATCASCHKAPPTTANHHNAAAVTTCNRCHGTTVNAAGAILVAGGLHLNGAIDTAGLTCATCHGNAANAATGTQDASLPAAPLGNATASAAPDTFGNLATTSAGVGVHASHLLGARSKPVLCNACHTVPGTPIHKTGTATAGTVGFGALATTGGITNAAYAGAGGGCNATYCHGNFFGGAGSGATATWVTAGTLGCTSCHGNPPAASLGHPQNDACATCHGPGYSKTGATTGTVSAAAHVNGVVDLATAGGTPLTEGCTSCHGAAGRANGNLAGATYDANQAASPPLDSHGVTSSVLAGVHLAHVNPDAATGVYKPVLCTECHVVPAVNRHANGAVSFTFAAATGANLAGFTPSFTQGNGSTTATTCATYCHGASLSAATSRGSVGTPAWNGAPADCASCHKAPPTTANHHNAAAVTTCSRCHGTTVDATGAVLVSGGLHINGTVNTANLTCATCHGNAANAATGTQDASLPAAPLGNATANAAPDTFGNTATTSAGVGVHASHLLGARSKPVLCNACHAVPGVPVHKTGVATSGAVAFGALATTGGITNAAYAGAGGGCNATYCHGNFGGGAGSGATPTWVTAGTLGCTSCHGNPPAASLGHPQNDACATCHGPGYSKTGATTGTVAAATHVNGTVELATAGGVPFAESCTSCHGASGRGSVATADANQAAAPPTDSTGSTNPAALKVGAHLAHVNQARAVPLSAPIACAVCHPVPGTNRHANGLPNVAFTGVAVQGGITSATYSAPSCAATWCHGNFTGGSGSGASPAWNVNGAQLGCTACHGAPPAITATAKHPQNPTCATCHPGYSTTGPTVVATTHVDGAITHTPATGCTQCHGDTTANGVANTDGRAAPAFNANAIDSKGNGAAATAQRGIGAHGKHLTGTTWRGTPVACGECHTPIAAGDTSHVGGVATVTFSSTGLAGTHWAGSPAITPVWNGANNGPTLTCSASYCHGNFPGGANATPTWATPSAVACGACHGIPPAFQTNGTTAHSTSTACGTCHGGTYSSTTVDPVLHMNGRLDASGGESSGGSSCGGCHGAVLAGMTGARTTRHFLAGGDVPFDTTGATGTWGSTLKSSAIYGGATCVSMCHGDHPHDLASPATSTHENNVYVDATSAASRAAAATTVRVGLGGSGTQNRSRTDFDATQANGGLCASCHRYPVDAGHPLVDKTAFDASAHDFTAVTVSGVPYTWRYQLHDGGFFARDCTKCHASNAEGNTPTVSANGSATVAVHFSDNASLLSGTSRPAGTPAGFVCYNCHGSAASPADGAQGNRSGKDIQSQIAHATASGQSGHPADSDTVHDSVAEQNAAVFGNALGVAAGAGQRHAACLDCHDPHEAKPTASTPPYTTGTVAIPTTLVACPATIGSGTKCATATGTGTTWTAAHVGWKIQAGGAWYTVVAFTSATSLTLYPAPSAAVAAGSAYTLQSFYRATNTAGPALQGAWGARFGGTLAALGTPTTANFTKATVVAGTEPEATVCLKCHSAYYWGASAPPATPVGATYTTGTATASNGGTAVTGSGTTWTAAMVGKAIRNNTLGVWHYVTAVGSATSITISPAATAAWSGAYTIASMATDVARELNPANVSFHPVLGTNSATLGNTGNILPPYTRSTLMTCTDCHESDVGTDPNGPHGSAARFILKGPNTTWGPSVTNSSSGMPAGTFCANCHRADFQGGRYTAHTNGRHNIACMSCHVAIPHGSGHAGLLVSLPGGAGGNQATDSSPYVGAQVRLGIGSYPATNTTAWGNSNCGCDSVSTGH